MNEQRFIFPDETPLFQDNEGRIRVINSRITLDTLVGAFERGDTMEEIAEGFPSISLEQIKAVIGWYLTHRTEADAYLDEQEAAAEKIRLEIESQPGYAEFRAEIHRRWEQLSKI